MHCRIVRATPENLGEGNRAHDDLGAPETGGLQMGASKRVACCQLREPLAIEDQAPRL